MSLILGMDVIPRSVCFRIGPWGRGPLSTLSAELGVLSTKQVKCDQHGGPQEEDPASDC